MISTTDTTYDAARPAQPERGAGEPEAIFVVGVARSGTTLMRFLLETSDRIAIARESHYLGHVFGRRGARHFFRRKGDLANDDAIRGIVEMIYSGEYQRVSGGRRPSPYWIWVREHVERDEVERRLLAAERTERGMFREFLRLYADAQGKPLMGEKTPTHLIYTDTLLEWFPDGRVIHMLRDPRAVYVSDRYRRHAHPIWPFTWLAKVPLLLESYLLVLTVVAWRRATRIHPRLERDHPGRYRLFRFEDVVKHPDALLPEVFGFLGVEVPAGATSVGLAAVHGMRSSDVGIDPRAADRWRERIHPFAKRFLEFCLRGSMRRFGYTD
jgi:hypothetical protein